MRPGVNFPQLFAGGREDLLTGLAAGRMITAFPNADAQVHEGIVRPPRGIAVGLAFIGPRAHATRGEHAGGQGSLPHGLDELRQVQLPT